MARAYQEYAGTFSDWSDIGRRVAESRRGWRRDADGFRFSRAWRLGGGAADGEYRSAGELSVCLSAARGDAAEYAGDQVHRCVGRERLVGSSRGVGVSARLD